MYTAIQELVSSYNDNLRGRCYICLEKFCETDEEANESKFSERPDFCRIDNCFHRFHLICLYRAWFMDRHVEIDEFGNKLITELPEEKRCPICRIEVSSDGAKAIKSQFESNDELVA